MDNTVKNSQATESIQNAGFVPIQVVRLFTPAKLWHTDRLLQVGHFLASLPALMLLAPLIAINFRAGEYAKGFLAFTFIGFAAISSLVVTSFGREQALRSVRNLERVISNRDALERLIASEIEALPVWRQIVAGVTCAIAAAALAQGYTTIDVPSAWAMTTSVSTMYVGFFLGIAFYLMLRMSSVILKLPSLEFALHMPYPHQTVQLKRVAEISVATTAFGAIIGATLTSLLLGLAALYGAQMYVYWTGVMVGVIVSSWLIASVPFIATQFTLAKIVRRHKESILPQLSQRVQDAFSKLDPENKQTVEQLDRLQGLYGGIYASPNVVLDWGIVVRYFASFLVSVITPITIGLVQVFME